MNSLLVRCVLRCSTFLQEWSDFKPSIRGWWSSANQVTIILKVTIILTEAESDCNRRGFSANTAHPRAQVVQGVKFCLSVELRSEARVKQTARRVLRIHGGKGENWLALLHCWVIVDATHHSSSQELLTQVLNRQAHCAISHKHMWRETLQQLHHRVQCMDYTSITNGKGWNYTLVHFIAHP